MSVQFNSRIGWAVRTQPDEGATPSMLNRVQPTLLQTPSFLQCSSVSCELCWGTPLKGQVKVYNEVINLAKITNNKQVICIETKIIFSSVTEAAKSVGKATSTMSRHLHGDRQTCGGKHFQFYDEWLEDQERQKLIQTLKSRIVVENEDGLEMSFDDIDEVGDYFYLEITGDEYDG